MQVKSKLKSSLNNSRKVAKNSSFTSRQIGHLKQTFVNQDYRTNHA